MSNKDLCNWCGKPYIPELAMHEGYHLHCYSQKSQSVRRKPTPTKTNRAGRPFSGGYMKNLESTGYDKDWNAMAREKNNSIIEKYK